MTRVVALRPTEFNGDVLPIDVAGLLQARTKCSQKMGVCLNGSAADVSDRPDGLLGLRARRDRPHRRPAEQRYELAPDHSITSSARPSSASGTVKPSARAVLRLMTNSNFVGCCTGSSAGFSPLRMRATNRPTCR